MCQWCHEENGRETHEKRQTDETKCGGKEEQRPADAVLITDPGADKHDNTGAGVRRRGKKLRLADGEAHVVVEDDGEEESEGIRLRGQAAGRVSHKINGE
jgi:hypothetical protein